MWKCKGPRTATTTFKKSKLGGLVLPNLKTHCQQCSKQGGAGYGVDE